MIRMEDFQILRITFRDYPQGVGLRLEVVRIPRAFEPAELRYSPIKINRRILNHLNI